MLVIVSEKELIFCVTRMGPSNLFPIGTSTPLVSVSLSIFIMCLVL